MPGSTVKNMPVLYAQVILPLPLHDTYTYSVPLHWQKLIKSGQRVVVQFGAKKYYAGLVYSVTPHVPDNLVVKEILEILDEEPVIFPSNLEMWKWMAEYYCCTLGDVFKAALPPALKLESKTSVALVSEDAYPELTEPELLIIDQLSQKVNQLDVLQKKIGKSFSYKALLSLFNRNIIQVEEKIDTKYKPKTEQVVTLHPSIETDEQLQNVLAGLSKARQQHALLLKFYNMAKVFQPGSKPHLVKKELLKESGVSASVLNELIEKKILAYSQQLVSSISVSKGKQAELNLLNPAQEQALNEINACFSEKKVALVHGVTASGKTEIYIHLIEEVLRGGRQALYLLPEIALTTQIIERLTNVFGQKVGIYHSRLNSRERVEIWQKVLLFDSDPEKGYQVILGARSALFMPFSKLGLVIVDEEHENSFKQFDPAPRYHARDMAVVLAKMNHADVLLGSATPSFESYYNALTGKYGLVNLFRKHSNLEQPEIIIADVLRSTRRKKMHSLLTPELFQLTQEALENREQVILFQNRRGYSPYIQCFTCGTIPKCKQCDVSLTWHKFKKRLNCHYCGYSIGLPSECPECGSSELRNKGYGTEKIEEEIRLLFPGAGIERMDLDTTRTKNSFSRIIRNLESGKTGILIGTQMVTKGLDFEHVRVAGILDADSIIGFPDFRSHERAFQLISQVSGRAGRKHKRGKVVVQTTQPDHPLMDFIRNQDFTGNFRYQMTERKLFRYPPYFRLIKIVVKHKKADKVSIVADELAKILGGNENLMVLGPEFPLVSRIQLWYIKEIWIKFHRNTQPESIKRFVVECVEKIRSRKDNSTSMIFLDVDPV
jgi:primosomal protein N' (replication factor Y) (superfamily II helicase)